MFWGMESQMSFTDLLLPITVIALVYGTVLFYIGYLFGHFAGVKKAYQDMSYMQELGMKCSTGPSTHSTVSQK